MTKNTVDWTKPVEFKCIDEWVPATVLWFDHTGALVEWWDTTFAKMYRLWFPNGNFCIRNKKESRAVPKDNRLDLTKPLVLYVDGEEDVPAKYIGPLHEKSRNFPAWFVVEELSGVRDERFFLMRGDGKTDIPGLTVRNKSEPRLKLPLEVGKTYRLRNGRVGVLDYTSAFSDIVGFSQLKDQPVVFKETGLANSWDSPHEDDAVEGPL